MNAGVECWCYRHNRSTVGQDCILCLMGGSRRLYRHGLSEYKNHGCRCVVCMDANAGDARERRRR